MRCFRAEGSQPQSRPAVAAIGAITGRNRVRLFLYIATQSSVYLEWTVMTTIARDIFVLITAAIFVAVAVLITTGAGAHEFKVGGIDIGHPWSRPTPADANIAGGYLTITNKGKTADRLISGSSPSAGQIEIHEVVDVDGMARTRPVANGIEIKPGKTIELKPGALRIVMLGLKQPLQLGQKIKGTLVFEKAGPIEVVYNVEENPGAAVSGVAGAQHKHH